jgi:uncharacterized protein (TIGR00369 family)
MGLSAAEIEELIDEEFPQARGLGWKLEHVDGERARVSLEVKARHLRPGPSVSGPTLMALADTAMYFAVLGAVGREPLAVTTSLEIHFMRRFVEGVLAAEAELLKVGKRLLVGRVSIGPDVGGPLVAHATVTYSVPPRRTSAG